MNETQVPARGLLCGGYHFDGRTCRPLFTLVLWTITDVVRAALVLAQFEREYLS
jgi:hypothetical protein